jgi:hypothetical protein
MKRVTDFRVGELRKPADRFRQKGGNGIGAH